MEIINTILRDGTQRLEYKDSRGFKGVNVFAFSDRRGWTLFIVRGCSYEQRTFKERVIMTKWIKNQLLK